MLYRNAVFSSHGRFSTFIEGYLVKLSFVRETHGNQSAVLVANDSRKILFIGFMIMFLLFHLF